MRGGDGSTLVVERCGPLVTIQDRGRRGFARHGIPASGPLDPDVFAAALAAVGGRQDDAALEVPLSSARLAVEGRAIVSIDGEPPREIVDGSFEVPAVERAVRYVAVRGGLAVPRVLGARATFVNGGFGGLEGRPLRRGDRVPIGDGGVAPRLGRPLPAGGPLVLLPTQDADAETLEALVGRAFVVDARSDRVGTRLLPDRPIAPRVPEGPSLSRPVVRGAVQLPPDGRPIVLGPDGPTTGGYALVGVLDLASLGRLARLRPGGAATFVLG